jgi:hypothetical protein
LTGFRSIQVYTTLSIVSFWGIPFTLYHMIFPPADTTAPLKKGNYQRDSSVRDTPFQLTFKVLSKLDLYFCTHRNLSVHDDVLCDPLGVLVEPGHQVGVSAVRQHLTHHHWRVGVTCNTKYF